MSNAIVVENITVLTAPTPATLQQSGAFVSQGGTTLTAGTFRLLSNSAGLASILTPPVSMTAIAWSGNVVTVTNSGGHGYTNADSIYITIAGVTPAGYNGTYLCTITSTTAFTYALVGDPGAESVLGTYVVSSQLQLQQKNNTYFQYPSQQGVYVLELGPIGDVAAIASLRTYIAANPNSNYTPGATGYFYAYLVDRTWATQATYYNSSGLLETYTAPSAMTYFFTTLNSSTVATFEAIAYKSNFAELEAPVVQSALAALTSATATTVEFSVASAFARTLATAPSTTNQATSWAFAFMYGCTAYPLSGNATLLATLKTSNINYIGTGAEGGISATILFYGKLQDGNNFLFWYATDWVWLNSNIALSNAVINGNNNSQAPLDFDQAGINTLQAVEVGVMRNAVSYNLVLGPIIPVTADAVTWAAALSANTYLGECAINADPFASYVVEQPTDYPAGIYRGLSVQFTPVGGFQQIVLNLLVQELA